MGKNELTIQDIKKLGKEKSDENLKKLLELYNSDLNIDLKREVVSSIGRQTNLDAVYKFISKEAFKKGIPMELIYQMFRTCLYREDDERFLKLKKRIMTRYKNENIQKMNDFHEFKKNRSYEKPKKSPITDPLLLIGDTENTLKKIEDKSVQLIFTSPPYYNAREYSDYHSYNEYLKKMGNIFKECSRVLEDGRFIVVNISPVITKRAGREFESIRYPIPYDFHKLLEEAGFYFMDEILWIKPEPSVPNRNGGYMQTRKPLSYKPNCITESLMVYRKKCDFLLDKNVDCYPKYDKHEDEEIDTSNCWYIAPKADKNHPAVFPDELCRRVVKYYSFENDVVLDPFAGSGTLGRVAKNMNRIPVMCEMNETYAQLMINSEEVKYDVRR